MWSLCLFVRQCEDYVFFRGLSVVEHFRQLSASPSQGFSCLANHEPAILLKFRAAFTSKTFPKLVPWKTLFPNKHWNRKIWCFCNIVALQYAIIHAPGKGIWKHHEYALENVWRVLFWSGGLFFAALVAGEFFVYSSTPTFLKSFLLTNYCNIPTSVCFFVLFCLQLCLKITHYLTKLKQTVN